MEKELENKEHVVHKVLVMGDPKDLPAIRKELEDSCLVGEPAQFTQAVVVCGTGRRAGRGWGVGGAGGGRPPAVGCVCVAC